MRLLPILLLASACAASSAREADLSLELEGRRAGAPEECAGGSTGSNLVACDLRTLVLHAGATVWVNRLAAACPALRPDSLLVVEPRDGSRYCRGDRFRAAEPTGGIPGPYGRLGSFTPYRR